MERPRLRLCALLVAATLAGCAGALPPHVDRPVLRTLASSSDSPLGAIRAQAGLASAGSAVWPLPQAAVALDARLAAIARATSSIDVQTYLLADDGVGRLVLRGSADAALRGVRVRVLVDDLYTGGLDSLLAGLSAFPGVEVRLFSPFVGNRSSFGRALQLAGDFRRLDHRMHNKLLVVDGQLSIIGGRNLADDYFLRSAEGNFFDVEVI